MKCILWCEFPIQVHFFSSIECGGNNVALFSGGYKKTYPSAATG